MDSFPIHTRADVLKLARSNQIIDGYCRMVQAGKCTWAEAINSMVVQLEAQNAGLAALIMNVEKPRAPA